MKKNIFTGKIIFVIFITSFLFLNTASAAWIWTPETKKFVNPKNMVKDSPKEQFDWAMNFYNSKDFQRAAVEFDKLTKQYEYSEYASKAQYYTGLCYENMNKFYTAFQNYQKALDNFPHIENMDEIIAREFNIATLYAQKDNPKVVGKDIMTSSDRAAEIYKKVVENAPYGRLADEAQFKMGEVLKKSERFDEAIQAFQKLIDDYPTSKFTDKARFEVADCAYKASLKPAYDVGPTDKAIKAFEEFSQANSDRQLAKEADKTIQRLRDKAAEKSLITAQFYERQKHYEAAIIYYQDVVDRYPDCSFVNNVKAKIIQLKEKGTAKAKQEAAGWAPIKFETEKKPQPKTEAAIVEKAVEKKEEPNVETAAPEQAAGKPAAKKSWSPFSFAVEKKPKVETEVPKEAAAEKPAAKKSWAPFSLGKGKKAKPGIETAAPEKTAEKKSWAPFSFGKEKKAEAKVETPVPEKVSEKTAAKKPWMPFSLGKEKKAEAPEKKAVEKKPWSPFEFGKKKQAVTSEKVTEKKPWTPFKFDKKEESKIETPLVEPKVEKPEVKEEEAVKEEPAVKTEKAEEKQVAPEDPDQQIEKADADY